MITAMHTSRVSPHLPKKLVKRRSARVKLTIPITIAASDDFVFGSETVSVSKHGAKIRAGQFAGRLFYGEELSICVRGASRESKPARIVWLDKTDAGHCGIELKEPGDVWGLYFP